MSMDIAALPKTACDEVYAVAGYESSVANLSRVTLASDNVFSTDRRWSWRW
jgi:hypothetical protein